MDNLQWPEMMADLGGQMGLWVGLSMIAIFEFLELFWDIGWYILGYDKYRCVICVRMRRHRSYSNNNKRSVSPGDKSSKKPIAAATQ